MDYTAWQAPYLRRREWVRSFLRLLAVLIGLLGLLSTSGIASVVLSASFGGSALGLVSAIDSSLTWLSVALAVAFLSTRLSRWIVPLPEPGCPRCGYSLNNLRSPICPECGLDLRPAGVSHAANPADRAG